MLHPLEQAAGSQHHRSKRAQEPPTDAARPIFPASAPLPLLLPSPAQQAMADVEHQRPAKRQRLGGQADGQQAEAAASSGAPNDLGAPAAAQQQAAPFAAAAPNHHKHAEQEAIQHILYVRWHGGQGQTKLNKLPLRHLDNLDALEELPKELVESHYPPERSLPDYFTNTLYTRFTPEVECLALPGDVVRTEVRLVLCHRSWEYTVLRQDANHREAGPEQTFHLMTAEFQGSDPLMAALGLRISLIAYPVVALSKAFLDGLHERLLASPDTFKGML